MSRRYRLAIGSRVYLVGVAETARFRVPPGRAGIITRRFNGYTVRFEACDCCGVEPIVSGLRETDLAPGEDPLQRTA